MDLSGSAPVTRRKDGREWRIGTDSDVAWIREATPIGRTITSAVPPVFEAYATVVVPDKGQGREEDVALLLRLLAARSPGPWWLGYLDTGADDVVFPDAPRVGLYSSWPYVLVHAGPAQAAAWRRDLWSWRAPGPDLVFPADRSWVLSWLWDDDWRCLGGPAELVDRVLAEPALEARCVTPDEDATPPGHVAR
ncbi:hypothetical protein [Geodermatophilus sp. SYSU D01119]